MRKFLKIFDDMYYKDVKVEKSIENAAVFHQFAKMIMDADSIKVEDRQPIKKPVKGKTNAKPNKKR